MLEVKVNAICYYPKGFFSEAFVNIIKEIFIEERKKLDSEPWEVDHINNLYKGSRYSNIDHLTRVSLGAIFDSAQNHLRKEGLDFETARENSGEFVNEWIETSSYSDLKKLVTDTLFYSMGSDHWYTFEKNWN
jgi:hypothetical protein